jgi:hypothetical protein
VRNQQTEQRNADCDCRNQQESPPLPILSHCGPSLDLKYTSPKIDIDRQVSQGLP